MARKRVNGQFSCSSDKKLVDNDQPHRWPNFKAIQGETQSTIVAFQDQAIGTNYFDSKILKEEIDSKCPLHTQHEETTDHVTSGCSILANKEY